MAEKAAPPALSIGVGTVRLTVWENETSNGGKRYSVQPSRSYLKDEQWQRTDYFNHGDLLNLAKLLERAEDWIAKQVIRGAQERMGTSDSGSPKKKVIYGITDSGNR